MCCAYFIRLNLTSEIIELIWQVGYYINTLMNIEYWVSQDYGSIRLTLSWLHLIVVVTITNLEPKKVRELVQKKR